MTFSVVCIPSNSRSDPLKPENKVALLLPKNYNASNDKKAQINYPVLHVHLSFRLSIYSNELTCSGELVPNEFSQSPLHWILP